MYNIPLAVQCITYGVMKEVKNGMGGGAQFLENGREGTLPSLLYADDMVLYGES